MTTTDTSSDSTDHDTQASAPAPAKKAPGRPRTADQPLTPAQRQKAYKQRQKAQALQLQREALNVAALVNAVDYPLSDPAGAQAAQAALLALPAQVLLRALADRLNELESDSPAIARRVARRVLVTLTEKYQLNREDDETGE